MDSKNIVEEPNYWIEFEEIAKQTGNFEQKIISLLLNFRNFNENNFIFRGCCDWSVWP